MENWEAGGGFYSAVIRFQSFSKPMALDCELHKYVSVRQNGSRGLQMNIFFLPHRRLEWAEVP